MGFVRAFVTGHQRQHLVHMKFVRLRWRIRSAIKPKLPNGGGDLFAKRRQLMNELADYCASLVATPEEAEVVKV